MADSTKAIRKSIFERDILPAFEDSQLNEITADDLRALANKVKARGPPTTATPVRDTVHGEKLGSPAEDVGVAPIATLCAEGSRFVTVGDRLMARQMESVAAYPTIRLALRMILLTPVRKSELIQATWDEVDFENATWIIPKQRMKGRNPHVVYLSRSDCSGTNDARAVTVTSYFLLSAIPLLHTISARIGSRSRAAGPPR